MHSCRCAARGCDSSPGPSCPQRPSACPCTASLSPRLVSICGAGLIAAAGLAEAAPRTGAAAGATAPAKGPAAAATAPTAAAATSSRAPVNRPPKDAPKYAPNTVLVRFKATPAAAAVAAGQARAPVVPGLQLVALPGEHQAVKVPSGPTAAAAAPAVPPTAIMKFRITDGASVEAKVAQLRANPGGQR